MPVISIGLSSYERAEGDLPALPVVNMFAEQTASEDVVLQSRRGLDDRGADMAAGPIEALFQKDGVISGNLFAVSDNKLIEISTNKGTVAGTGPASIAGNEIGIMVTAGASLYYYNGAAFSTVSFPDGANVVKVIEGASRFIALRENSGKFYWTDALGSTFDALDFATAESQADQVLDALFIDDILMLFGAETVEFWPNTGRSTLPFQPLEGRVIERGIKATGCATALGSTFAWVTNENEVCIGDENTIVSNEGLQARIAASTNVRLFTFFLDGVEFLALRLDNETQVMNRRTRLWSEFATYGQTNWVAQCFANGIFGSAVDGKTLQWGSDYTDALATDGILERRWRGGFPINGGGLIVHNVRVRCNVGQTPNLTGDYADPMLEMAISRDAGQTFGTYRERSLGQQGKYRKNVKWNTCGQASQPGFLAQWRLTDPVPLRVSGCYINEPRGGR